MKNRIVEHPNRYLFTPVAGTEDQFDLTSMPGVVTEIGSDFSKENMLQDTTSVLLGLDPNDDPQVDDALVALIGKVGDIKSTLRTDMGNDWTVCNGAFIDPAVYPAMAPFAKTVKIDGAYAEKLPAFPGLATGYSITGFARGNGYFVFMLTVSAATTIIMYSTDFTNWTKYSLVGSVCNGLEFKDGQFHVLVNNTDGYGGCELWSTSTPTTAPASWTKIAFFSGGFQNIIEIKTFKVVNNRFIALGSKNVAGDNKLYIATATSAVAATVYVGVSGMVAKEVVYNGAGYSIIGYNYSAYDTTTIYYTADFVTVAAVYSLGAYHAYKACAYFDGKVVFITTYQYDGTYGNQGLTFTYSATPGTPSTPSWAQTNVYTTGQFPVNNTAVENGKLWLLWGNENASAYYTSAIGTTITLTYILLASLLAYSYQSTRYFSYADLKFFVSTYNATKFTIPLLVCGNFLPTIALDGVYTYMKVKE